MPAFLPRFFKSRRGKPKKTENNENNREEGNNAGEAMKKSKRRWGFRFLRRHAMQQIVCRFKSKAESTDEESGSHMSIAIEQKALPPTPQSRRRRRPNIQTTQRKLAASKKRLSVGIPRKDTPVVAQNEAPIIPRKVTEISEDRDSIVNQGALQHCTSNEMRSSNQGPFVMVGKRGSDSIEVEFTDDSEPPSAGRYPWKSSDLKSPFPMSISQSNDEKEDEIGVEWKAPGPSSTTGERQNSVASRYHSLHSDMSSGNSMTRKFQCKSVQGSDCGSNSGSSDVAMDAWTDYRRDRMIEKIAGLKIQQPVVSQGFEAKRTMKISPPAEEDACMMIAYPATQDSKEPEWIQQWNSSFRSLNSCRSGSCSKSENIKQKHFVSGIPKPN